MITGTSRAGSVLKISHTLWTVVLPSLFPQSCLGVAGSRASSPVRLVCNCLPQGHNDRSPLRWDDAAGTALLAHSRHYDGDELVVALSEALFPLRALGASFLLRKWGGFLHAMNCAAAYGAVNVARHIASRQGGCAAARILSGSESGNAPAAAGYNIVGKRRNGGRGKLPSFGPLAYSCSHGHLRFAKWFAERFDIPDSFNAYADALCSACCCGKMECTKWLLESLLRRDKAELKCSCLAICALKSASFSGNLELAKYVHSALSKYITNTHATWGDFREASCHSGSIEVVKWAFSYRFPAVENYNQNCLRECMLAACEAGHCQVVEWLMGQFTKGETISHSLIIDMLYFACAKGQQSLVQWLYNHFDLDPLAHMQTMLTSALQEGNLSFAKWLRSTWGVVPIHGLEAFHLLSSCCQTENIECVLWAHNLNNFTEDDVHVFGKQNSIMLHALTPTIVDWNEVPTEYISFPMANFLASTFHWSPEELEFILSSCISRGFTSSVMWIFDNMHPESILSKLHWLTLLHISCSKLQSLPLPRHFFPPCVDIFLPKIATMGHLTVPDIRNSIVPDEISCRALKNLWPVLQINTDDISIEPLLYDAVQDDLLVEYNDPKDSMLWWALHHFNITYDDISDSAVLQRLCEAYYLPPLKVFAECIPPSYNHSCGVKYLKVICRGTLTCVQWFIERFQVGLDDIFDTLGPIVTESKPNCTAETEAVRAAGTCKLDCGILCIFWAKHQLQWFPGTEQQETTEGLWNNTVYRQYFVTLNTLSRLKAVDSEFCTTKDTA